jgi:hypothetical protein
VSDVGDGHHRHQHLETEVAVLDARITAVTARLDGNDIDDLHLLGQVYNLVDRVEALEQGATQPPPPDETTPLSEPFPVAWWARATEASIAAHADAGFTHNVIWSTDVDVAYLDLLHEYDIRAIPFLQPEFVGHPAVVAAIVADEPDLISGGEPKRTIGQVATSAANVRDQWPGLPVFSTIGSPCAAGPLSATEAESTEAGYWSLSVGPFNNAADDIERFGAYAANLDIAAPQMYTVAGNPDRPRYRRQSPLDTVTAAEAGVRQSDFVPKGMARARRLLPGVELWALLAPCQFRADFGRNPTPDELDFEAYAVIDGGGKGILYFDVSPDGSQPGLLGDPAQLAAVTDVIAELQAVKA